MCTWLLFEEEKPPAHGIEAVKSFISCPCDTGKQPLMPKIFSATGKMRNE